MLRVEMAPMTEEDTPYLCSMFPVPGFSVDKIVSDATSEIGPIKIRVSCLQPLPQPLRSLQDLVERSGWQWDM
jgi:hypothetical protein